MNLNEDILRITTELYKNLRLSRADIQYVISIMQKFIAKSYNPFLLSKLDENLYQAIDNEVSKEIHKTFEKYRDPFTDFDTEDKRLRLYKRLNLYCEPEICVLQDIPIPISSENKLIITNSTVSMVHLTMSDSLKNLLELDGLFDALLNYMEYLNNEKNLH